MQATTRSAHTDAGAAKPGTAILDATTYNGSTVTEKHWKNQDLPVGMVSSLRHCHISNKN